MLCDHRSVASQKFLHNRITYRLGVIHNTHNCSEQTASFLSLQVLAQLGHSPWGSHLSCLRLTLGVQHHLGTVPAF